MSKLLMSNLLNMPAANSDVKNYKTLHTIVGSNKIPFIDRTMCYLSPVRYDVRPKYRLSKNIIRPSKNYQECCLNKVEEILTLQKDTGKRILVAYSGGIDSTAIICSFIKQLGVTETARCVEILMSPHSIYENPQFYKKTLLPYFVLRPSTDIYLSSSQEYIRVDGEPNGVICGPEWLAGAKQKFGFDIDFFLRKLQIKEVETIAKANKINYDLKQILTLYAMVVQSAEFCGIKLKNMLDFIWWLNLNFRYQYFIYNHLRKFFMYYPNFEMTEKYFDEHFVGFYDSMDFQNWSIENRQEFLGFLTPGNWKRPCKELIYEVTRDEEYRRQKGKVYSLDKPMLLEQYYFGIDDCFKPVTVHNFVEFI